MKRFISTFIAAMMICSSIATTAFAADKNLVLTADKTTVKAGDNVRVLATLTETTQDIGAIQFSITFDPNVFELGEDDLSSVTAPPFLMDTLEKYLPKEYHQTYSYDQYASYYQFGSCQVGNELRDEGMTVTFAYAGGIKPNCGVTNKILGGAYLKVKNDLSGITNPKTMITITSPNCSYEGKAHNLITNDIEITLDGVGTVVPPVEDKKEAVLVDEEKANAVVDGLYTQGFKAVVTPNNQIVSEVKVVLSATKAAKTAEPIVWTAPVEGFASFEFAVNVLNVPDGETVTAAWDMTAAFAE